MLPLGELFARFGTPHYLKIDIQGYDQRIIEAIAPLPHRPNFISAEDGGAKMINAFHAIGATAFKLSDQTDHPSNKLPNPPREGRFCRHYFVAGSSGPFGEETSNSWASYELFRQIYVTNYRSEDGRWIGAPSVWFDIHAKFQ